MIIKSKYLPAVFGILVLSAAFLACESVADPEDEGGGGGGGGSSTPYRRVREVNATINVSNTQTSGPVGGAYVVVQKSSRFYCYGYTGTSGAVSLHDDCNFSIYNDNEVDVDISVSATGFNSVELTDIMFPVTEVETVSDVIWYELNFDYTVNLTPE